MSGYLPDDESFSRTVYSNLSDALFIDPRLKERRNLQKQYARALSKLESFVADALASKEVPFIPKMSENLEKGYHQSTLAQKHFRSVAQSIAMIGTLSDKYLYSEYIDTFRQACSKLGIIGNTFDWGVYNAPVLPCSEFNNEPNADVFNSLWRECKEIYRTCGYAAKRSTRIRDLARISDNYVEYMDSAFQVTDDIVVVRLDLFYLPALADSITLERACEDLSRLVEYHRCNKIFRHKLCFMAKIELGLLGRIHIHLILVYDGSKPDLPNHITIGRRVGAYWSGTITKNNGDYWNVNDKIHEFERWGVCGIGPININDHARRENFRTRVVRYLLKPDQFAKLRAGDLHKLLRRGKPLIILMAA